MYHRHNISLYGYSSGSSISHKQHSFITNSERSERKFRGARCALSVCASVCVCVCMSACVGGGYLGAVQKLS